jgi:hypothetical protein
MIGYIKTASFKHDRCRRINPVYFPVPGRAADVGLVCIEGYILLKNLSASGTRKLIKGHKKISPDIGCNSINNDTGFASE